MSICKFHGEDIWDFLWNGMPKTRKYVELIHNESRVPIVRKFAVYFEPIYYGCLVADEVSPDRNVCSSQPVRENAKKTL